jgi:hypothetical protein
LIGLTYAAASNQQYSPRLRLSFFYNDKTAVCRMRSLIFLLLFLVPVILVGIVWLSFHPQSLQQVSVALSSIGITPSAKDAPAGDSPQKPNPFETKERTPKASFPIPKSPRVLTAAPTLASVPEAHHGFPVANDIQPGTARGAIVALFGQPEATVTGSDRGQLMERFVYVDQASKRRTLIFLVNGRVTAAETLFIQ